MNARVFRTLLLTVALISIAFTSSVRPQEKKAKLSAEDEKKYELTFEAALAHHEKAELLFEDKKIDDAIKELEAIVKLEFPKGTEDRDGWRLQLLSHMFLAELLLDKKQLERAVDTLLAGLKKAPETSEDTYQLYMTLGHTYKEMKKTDEALKAFDKAQKINEILRKKKEAEEKAKSDKEKTEK